MSRLAILVFALVCALPPCPAGAEPIIVDQAITSGRVTIVANGFPISYTLSGPGFRVALTNTGALFARTPYLHGTLGSAGALVSGLTGVLELDGVQLPFAWVQSAFWLELHPTLVPRFDDHALIGTMAVSGVIWGHVSVSRTHPSIEDERYQYSAPIVGTLTLLHPEGGSPLANTRPYLPTSLVADVTTVPEPAMLLLVAAGLGTLATRRKFKRT